MLVIFNDSMQELEREVGWKARICRIFLDGYGVLSPTTYVPVSSPIPEALSFVRADLLPPHKRIRSSTSVTDLEVSSDESFESSVPSETGSRVDVDVGGSDEPYSENNIDPKVQSEIDECIAYADALRAGGIDARVVVKTVAREEVETSARVIDSRSPSFTPFGGSDFLMEEIEAFLEHDDSIPPGVDGIYDCEKPNNNQELFNPPTVLMADNRTMAQLLEAPTEGYEDAIVVPKITANNFEIKHGLL
ncbi:hypothetical protein Tco_0955191, partial [Tanacetum coccineum]